ncbi:MAG TPA: hypothetical protein VK324_10070, partial [Tepidisphaeraceae bacterium]|nr:hypothetical protein [Tepidisphaeraceae bacterium]
QPIETVTGVRELLEPLMSATGRPQPLVRELPPSPGSRAERYAQLLSPDAHDVDEATEPDAGAIAPAPAGDPGQVVRLERRVARLESALRSVAAQLGIPDPIGTDGDE